MNNNFNYISSIMLGVCMKIYDDFIDLKITKYPLALDISKIIIIMTTYFLIDEFYILSIVIFISLYVSNYCKKFDDIFWDAYMYFVGFMCLAYYNKVGSLVNFIEPFKLIFIIFIPISIYFEETTFTEEKSKNKIMARFYSIIFNTIIILYLEYFDFVTDDGLEFFIYLLLFINSYFLTNIIIQIFYTKYYEKLDDKKEDVKIQEEKIKEIIT
jgi:hypothetical protein